MSSPSPATRSFPRLSPLLWLGVAFAAASVWAVWVRIEEMSQVWSENPTYSHGYLVPLFSLVLLWLERRKLAAVRLQANWWGVAIIAAAALVQFAGLILYVRWLEGASLLVYLAGVAVLLGGWPLLRATWKAIGFLVFMIPLPFTIESMLRGPLRQFAAQISNFLLQLMGLPTVLQGTVIDVNGIKLGVEEACSGLAMLMTFFALAVGLILVIKRPWLDKLIIVLSALPIAIISNVIRITITGLLFVTLGEKVGKFVYHDVAGYLMMPLGIGLMYLELFILDHLLVAAPTELDHPIGPVSFPGLSQPSVRGVGRT